MTDLIKKVYDTDIDEHRVFLVVVDDSEEMLVALHFACMRAKNTGGRVALFRDIEPTGFHHWAGVSELMQDEARDCLLYTSPSPRDQRGSRMPSSA